jgi:hypothetical protein
MTCAVIAGDKEKSSPDIKQPELGHEEYYKH